MLVSNILTLFVNTWVQLQPSQLVQWSGLHHFFIFDEVKQYKHLVRSVLAEKMGMETFQI